MKFYTFDFHWYHRNEQIFYLHTFITGITIYVTIDVKYKLVTNIKQLILVTFLIVKC
jgi:hypothetical protein